MTPTPKEKAQELFDKFYSEIEDFDIEHEDTLISERKKYAKKCALICVEEMLSENKSVLSMLRTHGDGRNRLPVQERIAYMEDVKTEIENI